MRLRWRRHNQNKCTSYVQKKYIASSPKVIATMVEAIGTDSDDDDASAAAVLSLATFDPLPVVDACCLGALALVVVDDLQRKEGFFWEHLFIQP